MPMGVSIPVRTIKVGAYACIHGVGFCIAYSVSRFFLRPQQRISKRKRSAFFDIRNHLLWLTLHIGSYPFPILTTIRQMPDHCWGGIFVCCLVAILLLNAMLDEKRARNPGNGPISYFSPAVGDNKTITKTRTNYEGTTNQLRRKSEA